MLKFSKKIIIPIIFGFFIAAIPAKALEPANNILYSFNHETMSAQAYLVLDKESGKVLLEKNSKVPKIPASLTKLVTAMVFLDQNPNFNKIVKILKADEVGGARINAKTNLTYKLGDLFFASLVASTNNTTNALARNAGLSKEEFINRMNQKARDLGAVNSYFTEPTGISDANQITAEDYAKIIQAALDYPKIREAVSLVKYSFKAYNNRNYKYSLNNTDKLLSDDGLLVVGGKTGYLDTSGYNFAAELRDVDGKNIIVALLGSKSHETQFFETKQLAIWAWVNYKWNPAFPQIAGASIGLQMPDIIK